MSSESGCGCYSGCPPTLTMDPHKRVHYTQGLVLGVDEFVQEEYYFLKGTRRHHRALHGYGTVCGLGVEVRDVSGQTEVRVKPGHAIDTHGREVRLDTAQCAVLDQWLAEQADGSPPLALPSPALLDVWVVLCYRECLSDQEPIPGGPCRTADESMTATRVTESFSLRLDLQRPDMLALDTIRAFARLLGRLDPTPGGPADISIEGLEAEVEALKPIVSSPPVLPSPASPPDAPLRVPEALMEAYLHAAFRTWVTEVRPALVPQGHGCADSPDDDGCIALARLGVPVAEGGDSLTVDGGAAAVIIDDADRTLLLSTQVLQELLTNGVAAGSGGVSEHDELLGLDDDDHLQYLLIEERSPAAPPGTPNVLLNDLSGAGSFRLRNLPNVAAVGDAMPSGQPAGGDLSGALPNPTVVGLRGLGVPQPANADLGRHLAVGRTGGNLVWQLVDPPTPNPGGGQQAGEANLVRLRALSWLHNAASDLTVNLDGNRVLGIAIAFGVEQIGDARVLIGIDPERQRFDLGSLDIHSFRIYAEVSDERLPSAQTRLRLLPTNLLPIEPKVEEGQTFFNEAGQVDGTEAPGALLVLDDKTHSAILEQQLLVWVEIDGDHILGGGNGDKPRAVDTEFLRSQLPAGDRPDGADRGIQGGLFSSWINRASPNGLNGGRLDINRVDLGALVAMGVTPAAARRFLTARERSGGFQSFDDVRSVPQLSGAAINRLTNTDRVFIGPR